MEYMLGTILNTMIFTITFIVLDEKTESRKVKYLAKVPYLVYGRARAETKKSEIRGHEFNFGYCSIFL